MRRTASKNARLFAPIAATLVLATLATNASAIDSRGPSAPRDVRVNIAGAMVSVSWAPPLQTGAAPVESYTVTSRPAGLRCVTRVTHCRLRVKQPDLSYQVVITARNKFALGPSSAPSRELSWHLPGTSTTTSTLPSASTSTSSTTTTVPAPSSQASSQIVHDAHGNALRVQFEGLIDPATSGSIYFAPYYGYRYVAVELSMTSLAATPLTNDSTVNATVTGSDGRIYTGVYDDVTSCANLAYATYVLAPQSVLSGCVLFQLPLPVSVASVTYSLSFDSVDEAVWNLSPTP